MKHIFILISTSFFLFGFQGCGPDEDPETYEDIALTVPITFTPFQEEYNQGDTIWLEANVPDSLQDFYSRKWVHIGSEFDFMTALVFMQLVNPIGKYYDQSGNANAYSIKSEIGEAHVTSSTFGSLDFFYDPGSDMYKLKIGLIPGSTGLMTIGFLYFGANDSSIRDDIDLGLDQNGNPIRARMRFIHYEINMGQTNYHLLREAIEEVCCTVEDTKLQSESTYTFKVLE